MFQYGSNINGYDTTYAAKQNLYKFGVRTNVGKQSLSFIAIDIWKDHPSTIKDSSTFAFPTLLKHYVLWRTEIKLFISNPRKIKQNVKKTQTFFLFGLRGGWGRAGLRALCFCFLLLSYSIIYSSNLLINLFIPFSSVFTCLHTDFNWVGSKRENHIVYLASQLAHFISLIF